MWEQTSECFVNTTTIVLTTLIESLINPIWVMVLQITADTESGRVLGGQRCGDGEDGVELVRRGRCALKASGASGSCGCCRDAEGGSHGA